MYDRLIGLLLGIVFGGIFAMSMTGAILNISWQKDAVKHNAAVYILNQETGSVHWQWLDTVEKPKE